MAIFILKIGEQFALEQIPSFGSQEAKYSLGVSQTMSSGAHKLLSIYKLLHHLVAGETSGRFRQ